METDDSANTPEAKAETKPRRKFGTALEWLLFVKTWGGWLRAILGYLLLVTLSGVIWIAIIAATDLYAHPWLMWVLVAIASPASLLLFLVICRLLQSIFAVSRA